MNLHKSQCSDEERLNVLRVISHEIFITARASFLKRCQQPEAKHMRQMMGFFKELPHRQERQKEDS